MKFSIYAIASLAMLVAQHAWADGPAVDSVNGKISGGYGVLGSNAVYFGTASLDVPLGGSFGFQADGLAGGIRTVGLYGGGAHLFWRDPSRALFGIYAGETHFDIAGGFNYRQIAAEAEWYAGSVTLRGLAGSEGGDVSSRFFDRADIVWYPDDNLSLSVGQRYMIGTNAASGEIEYQFPGSNLALFAQGRLGEHDTNGIWAGLTLFLGSEGKALIDRARQDDPPSNLADSLAASSLAWPQKVCPFAAPHGTSCCPPGMLCIHH
jgi:hypothetical protein